MVPPPARRRCGGRDRVHGGWVRLATAGRRAIGCVGRTSVLAAVGVVCCAAGPLSFRMSAAECSDRANADCVLLKGTSEIGRLQIWFSRERGIASKISLDTEFSRPLNARQHEQLTFAGVILVAFGFEQPLRAMTADGFQGQQVRTGTTPIRTARRPTVTQAPARRR